MSPSLRAAAVGACLALAAGCGDDPAVPRTRCGAPISDAPDGAGVLAVAAGLEHTAALLSGGRVKAWGHASFGQLGLGDARDRGDAPHEMGEDLPVVELGAGCAAAAITAPGGSDTSASAPHGHHTCALLTAGLVKCWGINEWGQLGLGDTTNRGDEPREMGDDLPAVDLGADRTAVSLAAGPRHTCAILDDGSVKCWGKNSRGYLGLGDTEDRGDEPGEMGDHLPAVDLGSGRTARALSQGHARCALLDDFSLKCWGNNDSGQLGQGDVRPRGVGPSQMGDALRPVDLGAGRRAVAIGGGNHHACAVLDDGALKCWGENGSGQLGLGDTEDRGDEPGEMGDALEAISLGAGRRAVAVAGGYAHTCAVLDDGTVKCWGANEGGQLGLGDTRPRGAAPGEMGDALPAVDLGDGRTAVAITCGHQHTCALLDDGVLKCWGSSPFGQLGLGDARARGDDPGEMGDALPAPSL